MTGRPEPDDTGGAPAPGHLLVIVGGFLAAALILLGASVAAGWVR